MAADTTSAGYKNPPNTFDSGYCTWYAYGRVYELSGGKKLDVAGNAYQWYGSSSHTSDTPSAGACAACWTGGPGGYGHVGVVESYNASTGKLTFSDCNRVSVGAILSSSNIDIATMKAKFGPTFTFKGFVTL